MKQIMKIGNLDHVRKITIPWSSHVPRTVKASTLPAHNSPIDTLLIAIAVTRKWVDESAGRQVEWPMRLPRATHSRAEHERHLAGNRRAALPST